MPPRIVPRRLDRKSWAPNHFVTEAGNILPCAHLDPDLKLASARTTLALLKLGAKVPRAYW
jgi:hypothetical protein